MSKRKKNTIDLREWIETHGTDFVIKSRGGKPYISKKPKRDPSREKSVPEKKQVELFREAVNYAKAISKNPDKNSALVEESIKTGRSVYHLAISEYIEKHRNLSAQPDCASSASSNNIIQSTSTPHDPPSITATQLQPNAEQNAEQIIPTPAAGAVSPVQSISPELTSSPELTATQTSQEQNPDAVKADLKHLQLVKTDTKHTETSPQPVPGKIKTEPAENKTQAPEMKPQSAEQTTQEKEPPAQPPLKESSVRTPPPSPSAKKLEYDEISTDKRSGLLFLKINLTNPLVFSEMKIKLLELDRTFVEEGFAEQATVKSWWYVIRHQDITGLPFRAVIEASTSENEIYFIEYVIV